MIKARNIALLASPGPLLLLSFLVLLQCFDERVLLYTIRISTEEVLHASIFLGIPKVERNTVCPPPVPKSLDSDEFMPCLWNELDEPAVECPPRRRNAHAHRARVHPGNQNPWRRNTETFFGIDRKLSRQEIPLNALLVVFRVVHEREPEKERERQENSPSGQHPLHLSASPISEGLSSRMTVRNGYSLPLPS